MLSSKTLKYGHFLYIFCRRVRFFLSSAKIFSIADPRPYHAGSVCIDRDNPKTHGIDLIEFLDLYDVFRWDGLEPIFNCPNSCTGVAS